MLRAERSKLMYHLWLECWGCCALCGFALPEDMTGAVAVDHIQPISKGGAYFDVSNLQLVHTICNSRKCNTPGTRLFGLYAPDALPLHREPH